MTQLLKGKNYLDWSKGTWQSTSSSLAPENSVKMSINMDSDKILGELVTRDGETLVGAQIIASAPILGLHNYRGTVAGATDKLFAVVSDGVNSDIYDVVAGTKSLVDDTKDLKTRFLTYLDSCLRLNGIDLPAAWNGTSWITTGGVFDLVAIPTGSKYCIEFKDQIYVAGRADFPDRVDHSSVADPDTRTVSWTTGTGVGFFQVEQEDGGGGITGFAKVPGYLLIFKRRTMKRYDGSTDFPEDLVNQGAPSQESIVMAKGAAFWINEHDAWASAGGTPTSIGSFMVRDIIKSITPADLENVVGGSDEEHVFWSIPSCTISGEVYTNIVLKFNLLQTTWDIYQYSERITCFTKTVDVNNEEYLTCGTTNGNVFIFNYGDTDNGVAIPYYMETQDWDFGFRMFQKGINRMGLVTENVEKGELLWRNSHDQSDWKSLGAIDKDIKDINAVDLRGNFYNFKVLGVTDNEKVKILGFIFPQGNIKLYENTD